jgi:hypothetical protein
MDLHSTITSIEKALESLTGTSVTEGTCLVGPGIDAVADKGSGAIAFGPDLTDGGYRGYVANDGDRVALFDMRGGSVSDRVSWDAADFARLVLPHLLAALRSKRG